RRTSGQSRCTVRTRCRRAAPGGPSGTRGGAVAGWSGRGCRFRPPVGPGAARCPGPAPGRGPGRPPAAAGPGRGRGSGASWRFFRGGRFFGGRRGEHLCRVGATAGGTAEHVVAV